MSFQQFAERLRVTAADVKVDESEFQTDAAADEKDLDFGEFKTVSAEDITKALDEILRKY